MGLELIHPDDVETVVAPFRLTYRDLDLKPRAESHFTGECDFRSVAEEALPDGDFDLKLYWVLPHYHNLGTYFSLETYGGSGEDNMIFELSGFNADANGRAFAPAMDLGDARGFRFTCGYRNPRMENVGWGIGDQEMCVMLGFADSPLLFDGTVSERVELDPEGNIFRAGGECQTLGIPKNAAQGLPTQEEKDGPLYIPVSDLPADQVSPTLECEDADPAAMPETEATLSAVTEYVLLPGCSYTSCHGSGTAGGLRFDGEDLHGALLGHEVQGTAQMPLVDPGNPEGSWLYRKMAYCEPQDGEGAVTSHMPINSPILLDDALVALVREWIAAGAQDN